MVRPALTFRTLVYLRDRTLDIDVVLQCDVGRRQAAANSPVFARRLSHQYLEVVGGNAAQAQVLHHGPVQRALGLDGAPDEAVNRDQRVVFALARRPDKTVRLVNKQANRRGPARNLERRGHPGAGHGCHGRCGR